MIDMADGAGRHDLGKYQRCIAHAAVHARQLLAPRLALGLVEIEGIDVGHQSGLKRLDVASCRRMAFTLGANGIENPAGLLGLVVCGHDVGEILLKISNSGAKKRQMQD